jgi:hypothetical protein
MDKKTIYIGLGILAVGGLVYYFMRGGSSSSKSLDTPQGGLQDGALSETTETTATDDIDSTLGGKFVSAGNSRKQKRVNCRVEARQRGLRGKEKRQFRKDCRRAGGYDDGIDL